MVAAWMSAETGVGPSMASGSHTYSGICALFPVAPTKRNRQMSDSTPKAPASTGIWDAASATSPNSTVPKVKNTRKTPSTKPQSPTRLTMNAFLPASDALFL